MFRKIVALSLVSFGFLFLTAESCFSDVNRISVFGSVTDLLALKFLSGHSKRHSLSVWQIKRYAFWWVQNTDKSATHLAILG
jgi:hypothetical protein